MTEAEWWACNDTRPMLSFYQRLSRRKMQLFALGCCRRFLPQVTNVASLRALEISEQYAEGRASSDEVNAAHELACDAANDSEDDFALWTIAMATSCEPAGFIDSIFESELDAVNEAPEAAVLREIVGNPFSQPAVDKAWLSDNVVAIARAIYDDRAFDRLPILADALEDAGCTDAAVLGHCRQPAEHVRGCWVVDLVLEKE